MRIINQLIPFILAGILLAVMAFGLVLLAYLILIGTALGMILFALAWLRDRFFPRQKKREAQSSGRIIDSNDWRKL